MTKPLYLPNGTAALDFMALWCVRCQCEPEDDDEDFDNGCPIWTAAVSHEHDEEGYPPQLLEDDDGDNPRCTAFVERTHPGTIDPYAVEKAKAAYDALPRDPVTGRPVI